MISRLSALAALFAVVTTASLAYAANVKVAHREARAAEAVAAPKLVVLERVVVTGKRASLNDSN